MGSGSIEILYDDGQAWQEVLGRIRIARAEGREPTCVLMNVDTAKILIEQTEFYFEAEDTIRVRMGGLPVKLQATIPESLIYLGYD